MRGTSVCPWQAGKAFNSGWRKLVHNPEKLFGKYIKPGMTVMDIGCGMGYFTLPMAEMAGSNGRVIAIDVQREMLDGALYQAEKAGLSERIVFHQARSGTLDIEQYKADIDFALLFMMLHEVPEPQQTIRELRACLRPNAVVLFAEPLIHVSRASYLRSLEWFRQEGFCVDSSPAVAINRAVILSVQSQKK